jgi:hypothetical protein
MQLPLARRLLLGILCGYMLSSATGCDSGPTVVPVSGTATIDGEPLSGFVVTFIPDKEKGNTAEVDCSARLGQDGGYSLQTDDRYKQYKGAPPGWYKVAIWSPEDKPIPINPAQLSGPAQLSVEVKPDAPPGAYDLKFTK